MRKVTPCRVMQHLLFGGQALLFIKGGTLSAVRAQCRCSATIWASSRIGDPYFVILGASLLPLA